jgi:hypothetical protein
MYITVAWSVFVPSKIQLFLWLLSHNKLAMVDNLNKKGMQKPEKCVFCEENESISHLFFECSVAKIIWKSVSEYLGVEIGADYTSVASKWLCKKKFATVNVISTAVLRAVWLTRNDFVFKHQVWSDVKLIWNRICRLSMEWKIIYSEAKMEAMMRFGLLSWRNKLPTCCKLQTDEDVCCRGIRWYGWSGA